MLTFEWDEKKQTLEVFLDKEGRDQLIGVLRNLQKTGDHDHLMTPAWSGNELDEEPHNPDAVLINMVTIGMPR